MVKKTAYYTLILFFLLGCIVASPDKVQSTKQPTATRADLLSTALGKNPLIEKVCSDKGAVPLTELGLPDNLVLLAVQGNEGLGGNLGTPLNSDVLEFSGGNQEYKKLEKIRSKDNDSKIVNAKISPDGRWLALFRWDATHNQETLWISSLDGEQQKSIAGISPKQKVFWTDNNEIVVVGVPNGNEYEGIIPEEDMRPLLIIDPSSSTTVNLPPLPESAIYIGESFNIADNKPYSLYYKEDNQKKNYFLYDYDKKASTQVFNWLKSLDNLTSVGIRPNGLYYAERVVGRGIDFVVDLSKEQIAEDSYYDRVMKHLELSENPSLEISSMLSGLTKNNILVLTSDPADYEKPTPVYFFDYKSSILKDYCINLGSVSTNFSPDERFVAFTINEGADTEAYHILLLNLNTGSYSDIKNSKAIGFGLIE